jgi:ubiquitin C-terminal hydrolase
MGNKIYKLKLKYKLLKLVKIKKCKDNGLFRKYFNRWKIKVTKGVVHNILLKLLVLFIDITRNNYIKKILAKKFNKWRRMNNNSLNYFNNNYINVNQQESFNYDINNINNNNIINEVKLKKYPLKIGLENLGNTSYLNASLQCLFNIESLSKKLLNKYLNLNINTQQLTCAYTTLLYELKKENSKYIDPSIFKKTVGELNPLFQGNAASDSKDLIFFIIERLHQELKPPTLEQKNQIDYNQQEFISQYDPLSFQQFVNDLKNSKSCIFDTFYGIHKIQMQCNNCHIIKYSYQTFNMLVFILKKVKEDKIKSIGNEYYTGIDLYDAFENDRKLEILDGENMIYCNKCKCLCAGSHQQMIFSLPPVLIIVLNRGRNNLDFNEKFDFPEVLNLLEKIM